MRWGAGWKWDNLEAARKTRSFTTPKSIQKKRHCGLFFPSDTHIIKNVWEFWDSCFAYHLLFMCWNFSTLIPGLLASWRTPCAGSKVKCEAKSCRLPPASWVKWWKDDKKSLSRTICNSLPALGITWYNFSATVYQHFVFFRFCWTEVIIIFIDGIWIYNWYVYKYIYIYTCMNQKQKHVLVRERLDKKCFGMEIETIRFTLDLLFGQGVLFVRLRTVPGFSSSTSALAKAYAKADWCLSFFPTQKMARKIHGSFRAFRPKALAQHALGTTCGTKWPKPFRFPLQWMPWQMPWISAVHRSMRQNDLQPFFCGKRLQHGQLWTRDIQPSLTNIFCTLWSKNTCSTSPKRLKSHKMCGVFFPLQKWHIQSNGGFPKIVVPPNHPFLGVFHYFHHPFWDTPILRIPPCNYKLYNARVSC